MSMTFTPRPRIATAIALLLLAPLAAIAEDEVPPERRFEFEVRALVFQGLEGDVEALEQALAMCDQALERDPNDAEALVWRGSTTLVLSGVAYRRGDLGNGGALWQKGLAEMERAVGLAPDDVGVLIPRAAALLGAARNVPFPQQAMDLTRTAVGDYERVYELQRPYFDRMSEHARGELLLGLADGHQRLGQEAEVRRCLEIARTELPGTAYAEEADAYLDAPGGAGTLSIRTCRGCHSTRPEEEPGR